MKKLMINGLTVAFLLFVISYSLITPLYAQETVVPEEQWGTFPLDEEVVPGPQVGTISLDGGVVPGEQAGTIPIEEVVPGPQAGTIPIDPPQLQPTPVPPPLVVAPPPPATTNTLDNTSTNATSITNSPAFTNALNNRNILQLNNRNDIDLRQSQSQNQRADSRSNASTGPISINVQGNPGSAGGGGVQTVAVPVQMAVRTVPAAVTTTIPTSLPQKTPVAGTGVVTSELPRTGLPLFAWIFSALLPLGLKLRKFGREKLPSEDARYLWQKREWGKGE